MSFQAYLDAVMRISGKSIEDIKTKMQADGLFRQDVKADTFVAYLKDTYQLGRGHSMALWKYAIESNWFTTKHNHQIKNDY